MHTVASMAAQVAHADVPVLITGPNGAGKEVLADIVHANSARKDAALRQGQRRRPARSAHRGRAVRHRGRRVHRRQGARRPLRSRRRRHAVPRRDRQPAAGRPGQTTARAADRRIRAPGLQHHAARQRAHRRRDQHAAARRDARGPLPRGPVLPPERDRAARCRRSRSDATTSCRSRAHS